MANFRTHPSADVLVTNGAIITARPIVGGDVSEKDQRRQRETHGGNGRVNEFLQRTDIIKSLI